VSTVVNYLLTRPTASRLYYAIIMARPSTSHAAALDPYLAGLVAYATTVGLVGRPYWRNALWVVIAGYAIVHVGALHTSILTLLITVIAGRAVGLAVRYGAGSASQRPGALEIAGTLAADGLPVSAIRRVRRHRSRQGNPSRRYAVITRGDGCGLDVVVYDRDQQAAGAIYRLYRRVRVRGQVSRGAPLSVDRAVGCRALLSYAAEEAGAPTPRLRAVVRAGPEAFVLAYEHHEGTTLAERGSGCSDAELSQIWDAVARLHARKVTHRGLTADRLLPTGDGQAVLLDPGDGDVAASDLQIRLDVAQLLVELALVAGPDRAAGVAVAKLSADDLVAVVSLPQPWRWPTRPAGCCAAAATCCPRCAPGCWRRCRAARSPRPGWSASGRAPC
jgi:glycosyltransferase 2 family protein